MVKQVGEIVTLSSTGGTNQRPFGLCANFVGGQLDELYGGGEVGVWRGQGGVFEILAPFFDATGGSTLATDSAAENGLVATEIYFKSSATGVLKNKTAGAAVVGDAARLVSYLSANAIVVELLV